MEDSITVLVKFQGRPRALTLPAASTLGCLKRRIEEELSVPQQRQKLLGCRPNLAADDTLLSSVTFPAGGALLMGAPDAVLAREEAVAAAAPPVVDDLGDDDVETLGELCEHPEVVAKLGRRVAASKHLPLNPPREGMKLLVLDVDYTLFDHVSAAERAEELARPHLHSFLTNAYRDYDIIIWSATNMKWIELKMRELGCSDRVEFRFTAYVDHASMVTVGPLPKYGVFDCKPLAYIWAHYPMYSATNTIMFDDLGRNFVMNPRNGLKIRPFRNCHQARYTDDELSPSKLGRYLAELARLESFVDLRHSRWERWLEKHARR